MTLKQGTDTIKAFTKSAPNLPGVYRMISEDNTVLYIGKARNLKNRITTYTNPTALPYRLQKMISMVYRLEITTTNSEAEALLLEANLVKSLQPRFNILLRDDKSFPYILLTSDHEYNQILKHRGQRKRKGDYFGPFVSAGMVNKTISTLQRAFPLRSCSDNILNNRKRPCLEYQIKRCTAPCVGKISPQDYAKIEQEAREFLSGKSKQVKDEYIQQMKLASDDMDYEKAAVIRDRIRALTQIQAQTTGHGLTNTDADIVAIHREGNNSCIQVFIYRNGHNMGNNAYFPRHHEDKTDSEVVEAFIGQFYQNNTPPKLLLVNTKITDGQLLEEALGIKAGHKVKITQPQRGDKLKPVMTAQHNAATALKRKLLEDSNQHKLFEEVQKTFDLPHLPERIEVYDNSHIQGTDAIGGMIVATREGFAKKEYRKFNIRTTAEADDYSMMHETLSRRFTKLQKEEYGKSPRPDIILIDGGKGHLKIAAEVLEELGVNDVHIIAIAKGQDRNAGLETYHQLDKDEMHLSKNSIAYFMQRLRDEAHRYAIGSHRQKRSSNIKRSELDSIPGVGAARKRALLEHFGSVQEVKNASIDELGKVNGMSATLAEKLYEWFH